MPSEALAQEGWFRDRAFRASQDKSLALGRSRMSSEALAKEGCRHIEAPASPGAIRKRPETFRLPGASFVRVLTGP